MNTLYHSIRSASVAQTWLAMLLAFYTATASQAQQFGQGFNNAVPAPPQGSPNTFQQPSGIPSIPSSAQAPPADTTADPTAETAEDADGGSFVPSWISSLKSQLLAGGILMIPLAICSLIVIGLIGERLIAMRRGRVIPRPFVRRFREKLEDGQLDYDESLELCNGFDCPVADVFYAAVKRSGRSAVEIEAAIVDALDRAADGLRRYLRVFHAISNVAPLLGLLGTVLGMIEAFETMSSEAGMGRPELLASGISQALVTTATGLFVAIPAYLAYMYFSARADRMLAEIEHLSLSVVDAVSAEGSSATSKSRRKRAA